MLILLPPRHSVVLVLFVVIPVLPVVLAPPYFLVPPILPPFLVPLLPLASHVLPPLLFDFLSCLTLLLLLRHRCCCVTRTTNVVDLSIITKVHQLNNHSLQKWWSIGATLGGVKCDQSD